MRMDLGVFVAYKWEWVDSAEVKDSDGDEVDKIDNDDYDRNTDEQGSKDWNSDEDGVRLPYIMHTVIFRCIGSNREESYQLALRKSKQLLKSGQVLVELRPEPTPRIHKQLHLYVW